jgi:hypothetical protein
MRREGPSDDRQRATTPGNCLGSMLSIKRSCRHVRLPRCTRAIQISPRPGRPSVERLCKVRVELRLARRLFSGICYSSIRPGQIRGGDSQRRKWLFLERVFSSPRPTRGGARAAGGGVGHLPTSWGGSDCRCAQFAVNGLSTEPFAGAEPCGARIISIRARRAAGTCRWPG